jgi:Fe-S-cluster containining protein
VYLTPEDAETLARGIHISLDAISTNYINHASAADEGEWGKFKIKPCVFLRGNLCSIYDQRPDACRRYPQFTPDFRWTLADTIQGAALCPIIYNVLDVLAAQLDDIVKKL